MKKKLPLIVIGGLLALGLIIFGAYKIFGNKNKAVAEPEKKRISEPVNIIEVSKRPYVSIEPVDSRNIAIVVHELKMVADDMEYELEYQAGSLLQGAFGLMDLTDLPSTEKILLGSCSAGGACTYHQDVKGGTLLGKFNGNETYALKADWKYIENSGETDFSSKDAKFQISSADLKNQSILIIFNGFGYPADLPGELASEPYGLAGINALKGEGELTIRANSEEATKIVGFDGSDWVEFETQIDGKMLTANVSLMPFYAAVK